jgi:hypothetical protein
MKLIEAGVVQGNIQVWMHEVLHENPELCRKLLVKLVHEVTDALTEAEGSIHIPRAGMEGIEKGA